MSKFFMRQMFASAALRYQVDINECACWTRLHVYTRHPQRNGYGRVIFRDWSIWDWNQQVSKLPPVNALEGFHWLSGGICSENPPMPISEKTG